MRRGRIFIYLGIVLIVGLGAVLLLPKLISGPSTPAAEPTPSLTPEKVQIEVVAVVQPVKRGDALTLDVLHDTMGSSTVTGGKDYRREPSI